MQVKLISMQLKLVKKTIPEGYQWGVRKSQITDLIGDGWTVDVIKHILSCLKGEN